MKNTLLVFCMGCFVFFLGCSSGKDSSGLSQKDPVDYVDPYIGSISHLLVPTYPTTHLPHSMLRVYPLRKEYTTDYIEGLPLIVPKHRRQGLLRLCPMTENRRDLQQNPRYHYDFEETKPYRYSVWLDDVQVQVNYAPSHQSGLYRLNFEEAGKHYLSLNVDSGSLKEVNGAVMGYGTYERDTKFYVYMDFDQKPESVELSNKSALMTFNPDASQVHVRYGISLIDEEQAKKNAEREIKDYNVDQLADAGKKEWNEYLSKIQVEGDEDNKSVFYTAVYRTAERMINISEDGRYFSAFDHQIHNDEGTPFYTDDWIWDTYLATHPLGVLTHPAMESQKITSYIRMYEQSGWMPTFPGPSGDDHAMNGNHYVASIWDAYIKGIKGFDLAKAYEGCKKTMLEESMLPWVKGPLSELDVFFQKNGFYPGLHPGEKETVKEVHSWEKRQSVAITQAAAFDYWCLAQMAKELGKEEDHTLFMERSLCYRNLFNPETGFFHPKDKEGKFIEPFDYVFSGGVGARDYYDENNAWTYRWQVQHNISDMIQLMGGAEKFATALDEMYMTPLGKIKWQFYSVLPDQTGNVGQFTMANEPSFHIPYLYNYAGQPWKTQKRIRSLMDQWFRNDKMGIPGDEDGGGMSAFVAFSMMGFYPVSPGKPVYNIGSPSFEKVTVTLENGKKLVITAKNCSKENKYVQSIRLNGTALDKVWFNHSDIADGGTLEMEMGNRPNMELGKTNLPQ